MMLTTTLAAILEHKPCAEGWAKLLRTLNKTTADDDVVTFAAILDSNGLDDALWALRTVEGHDREIRLFAVWCARQMQHLMTDARSIAALDVAERYAHGTATFAGLLAARDAARDAVRDVAWAAARDAVRGVVGDVAWAAARDAVRGAVGDVAWGAARAAAGAAARAAVGDVVGDVAWDAARDAVRAAARAAVGDGVGDVAWDAARDAVGDVAWAAARDAARDAQVAEFRRRFCQEDVA